MKIMIDKNIISIVIPVYKSEKYIDNCIQSIINQTISNWELLLIDDGSPDKSGEICNKYAKQDKRISVFHKNNGGVSSARNFGLDKANGEWLAFVDSDDILESTYLADFQIEKHCAELYIQGYKKIRDGKVIEEKHISCKQNDFVDIVANAENNNIINSPCFKLFRTSIIKKNKIYFDTKLSIGEDHLFSLQYLLHISHIQYTKSNGYCYMLKADESLSNRVLPINEFLYYTCECRKLHEEICKRYDNNTLLHSAFDYRLLNCVLRLLRDFYISGGDLRQYKRIHQTLADIVGHCRFYLKRRYRLFLTFYLAVPDFLGYSILKKVFYAK